MATLAGIALGLGIVLMLFVYGLVVASIVWLAAAMVIGGLLGWIVARLAPARPTRAHAE